MKITRTGEDSYTEKGILPVSFSELIAPTADDDIIDLRKSFSLLHMLTIPQSKH